jgi:hypothetical protein
MEAAQPHDWPGMAKAMSPFKAIFLISNEKNSASGRHSKPQAPSYEHEKRFALGALDLGIA